MLRSLLPLFFVLFLFGGAGASEILRLIKAGQLDKARSMISESVTAVRRDGNLLFYQALLEPDGGKSYQFLEASFKADLSPLYMEDYVYQMALYFLAEANYDKLASTSETYLQHWENGAYRTEILRLGAFAYKKLENVDKAALFLKRVARENDGKLYGNLANLAKAYQLYSEKKYINAQKICRKLRTVEYDEAVVPALYMLSFYSLEQRRTDDAILYYNILRERFPKAVGLDDLVDMFGNLQQKPTGRSAEEITGTKYSVQAGVFSIKKNANKMADRLKAYGQKVEIKRKKISDKNYYVVYVGRFTSMDEAMAFKNSLEQSENEAFHVVAR